MRNKKLQNDLDIRECKSISDFLHNIAELKKRKIIIYGAGKLGQRLLHVFSKFGIKISFFWDIEANLLKEFDSIKIKYPDFNEIAKADRDKYIILVTVIAENVCNMIFEKMLDSGYNNIISDKKFLDSLSYFECKQDLEENKFNFDLKLCHICSMTKGEHNRCDIFNKYTQNKLAKGVSETDLDKAFIIPSMGILVSNRCTLTCVGCNHLINYSKPENKNITMDADNILEDLNKILSAADMVNKVVIVGGEAFLYKDILYVIDHILRLPKIGIIQIITNGTVVPKNDQIFELLSNPRVILEISQYGDNVPERLQKNIEIFVSKLQQYNVKYLYPKSLKWSDFGNFNERGYSKKKHRQIYSTCCFVSNDLFDGKLYKCSRSAYGTFLKKIPDFPSDYVDVHETSASNLRKKLLEFFDNKAPKVCQFCNGTSSATITPGIQLKQNKDIQ